jgi:hypothetical protein
MSSLIKRIAYDAAEPFERLSATFLRKATLFLLGLSGLLVSFVFLTIALNDFLQSLAGTEIAALIVGGVYLSLALISLTFVGIAMRDTPDSRQGAPVAPRVKAAGEEMAELQSDEPREFARQIDDIVTPMLDVLHDAGLERERATLVAGAAIVKELKPLTGVAFAIVTGFIVGRSFRARP